MAFPSVLTESLEACGGTLSVSLHEIRRYSSYTEHCLTRKGIACVDIVDRLAFEAGNFLFVFCQSVRIVCVSAERTQIT